MSTILIDRQLQQLINIVHGRLLLHASPRISEVVGPSSELQQKKGEERDKRDILERIHAHYLPRRDARDAEQTRDKDIHFACTALAVWSVQGKPQHLVGVPWVCRWNEVELVVRSDEKIFDVLGVAFHHDNDIDVLRPRWSNESIEHAVGQTVDTHVRLSVLHTVDCAGRATEETCFEVMPF